MKHFLYLDIDIVNSIIAQSEKGLVQSMSNEQESSGTTTSDLGAVLNTTGKFGGSLAMLVKAEADLSADLKMNESELITSASREIISKTLHDAAFDIAFKCISPSKVEYGDESFDDTGNYVLVKRVFDFVDFNYLVNLFSEDGIVGMIKKHDHEKIIFQFEKQKEKYNREQLHKAKNNLNTTLKKTIDDNNKKYDDMASQIKALRGLIPYERMLISNDGYLIPLNTKYFRVDPLDLGFRYGGEITCVGMITNIIREDTAPIDNNNVFASLQFMINETLRKILPTDEKNLCVISPIAIYYDS